MNLNNDASTVRRFRLSEVFIDQYREKGGSMGSNWVCYI